MLISETDLQSILPRPAAVSGVVHRTSYGGCRRPKTPKQVDPLLNNVLTEEDLIWSPTIRSTAMRDAGRCRRLFMYKYRLGLRPRSYYVSAYITGGLFHHAVYLLTRGYMLSDVIEALGNKRAEIAKKLAEVSTGGLLPDGRPLEAISESLTVDTYKAMAMARSFCTAYKPYPEGMVPLDVEKTVYARVQGIKRVISGRLDMIAEETETKHLWIIEHKTTDRQPRHLVGALSFDLQPQLHRLLLMALYPERVVAGVIHNIVQKPSIKYCPKTKDETPEAYFDRVQQWYTERTTEGSYDPDRLPVIRSRVRFFGDLPSDDFMNLLRDASRISYGPVQLKKYPRVSNNYVCMDPSFTCPFLGLCREENPIAWRHLIGTKYEHHDPQQKAGEEDYL